VYHDDPEVTPEDKLRVDACITVPKDAPVDGEIGKMTVPGGKFAVAHFEISGDEYGEAWNALMGGWLPESGYQPDDRLCYELYLNNPKEQSLSQQQPGGKGGKGRGGKKEEGKKENFFGLFPFGLFRYSS